MSAALRRNSHQYQIVGFTWSDLKPAIFDIWTHESNWMQMVRDAIASNPDFQFTAVVLPNTPVHRSDAQAPSVASHPREFLVVGFDMATRRTTAHKVLALSAWTASEAVRLRWRNSFHHIVCGAYEAGAELLLTLIGFLDANQPVSRMIAEPPANETEADKPSVVVQRLHA